MVGHMHGCDRIVGAQRHILAFGTREAGHMEVMALIVGVLVPVMRACDDRLTSSTFDGARVTCAVLHDAMRLHLYCIHFYGGRCAWSMSAGRSNTLSHVAQLTQAV